MDFEVNQRVRVRIDDDRAQIDDTGVIVDISFDMKKSGGAGCLIDVALDHGMRLHHMGADGASTIVMTTPTVRVSPEDCTPA
jgi:hypothetical protein